MFNARSVGVNHESCKQDFGDQARGLNQQGYAIAQDIVTAVKLFLEHFPKRSIIHNGLEIECRGEIDDVHGELYLTIRTLRVAGGL